MKSRGLLICFLSFLLIVGCASSKQIKKKTLSADEQIRLAIENQQDELLDLLRKGSTYIDQHPEKNQEWKSKILPIFKEANQMIGDLLKEAKSGMIFYPVNYSRANSKLREIRKILTEWGAL